MHLFYSDKTITDSCTLDEQESRHAIKVLRLGSGDKLWVTDGSGMLFQAIIRDPSARACSLEIISAVPGSDIRDYKLHIAISPLKNPDRFEWFVEKAVEIGIDEITPLICEHSEKPGIKKPRIEKIIITAMKQSLKTKKTVINDPVKYSDFISGHTEGTRLIAHCNPGSRENIADIYKKGENCTILIGPEGDFSGSETAAAAAANYSSITLGPSRLRTETAGIAACHSIYFINL